MILAVMLGTTLALAGIATAVYVLARTVQFVLTIFSLVASS